MKFCPFEHILIHFIEFRLSELRNQKQKMLRQVRDKEEELETAMAKIDTLRQDLRKSEKLKREVEARAEELEGDAIKEKKLRERIEEYTKGIESELENVQDRTQGRNSTGNNDSSQEVLRFVLSAININSSLINAIL